MAANKPSGIYHKTSIDAARASYTTLSHIGQKRNYDQFQTADTAPRTKVLSDITNRGDFQRPTLHVKCFEALKASEIQNVGDRNQSEYSQRRGLALTPSPASNPFLDLSHPAYGLPDQLVQNFAKHGVKSIYPWQSDCLLHGGVLAGQRNLVYTAPTGVRLFR
jgi:DNA polymerase theta